jgi:hypothetical protein
MKAILALLAILALATPSVAQHAHGSKGPNGGIMEDVAGVHAELLTSGNTITINIFDESNKPVTTQGYTGSILVASGGDRETVKLEPAGTSLKGEAKKAPAASTQFTLMIKTAAGKSGQARYKK